MYSVIVSFDVESLVTKIASELNFTKSQHPTDDFFSSYLIVSFICKVLFAYKTVLTHCPIVPK